MDERKIFSSPGDASSSKSVITSDNSEHPVVSIGEVSSHSIDGGRKICKHFLHVLRITKNLIFVGQIVEQGYQLWFMLDKCFIEDPNDSMKVIAKGAKEGHLFCFIADVTHHTNTTTSMEDEESLWHKRLNHVNCNGLRALQQNLMSNMSGRGGVHTIRSSDGQIKLVWDGIVPAECEADEGAVLRLNSGLKWEEAHEPLHIDIDLGRVCGVGPGLVFAATLSRNLKATHPSCLPTIGLVPCAIGGTQIKEWEKGSNHYENMIQRTKVALSNGGSLKGLLWYQGEADTYSLENANEFRKRLEKLVWNIRSDLQYESLPVIQVGITANQHPQPEILEQIREIQQTLNIPGVYYIDAKGLPLQEDNIHLTTDAQRTLGQMFVDAYMNNIFKC